MKSTTPPGVSKFNWRTRVFVFAFNVNTIMAKLGIAKKKQSMKRVLKKKRKNLTKPVKHVVVEGLEFLNKDQLKKLKKNPTNSIRASGKRKQKVLKRIRQSQRAAAVMEVEPEPQMSKSKKSKAKKPTKATGAEGLETKATGAEGLETMDTE